MAIAEEIALVEREFVPGEVLLLALMKQENLNEFHTASWFLRNITQLNAIPMLTFNAELRDFEVLETPWASDIFYDLNVGGVFEDGPICWDENGDGYEGGWLSSDLKRFFSSVGVTYPEAEIKSILINRVRAPASARKATKVKARLVDDFLASRGHDFVSLEEWLNTLTNKSEISRVGLALRLAFDELQGFVPLYYLDTAIDASLPTRMTVQDAAATWSDLLVSFALDEMPDCFFGDPPSDWRWCGNIFLKKVDCGYFEKRSGLGSGRASGGHGELEEGVLDFAAARARGQQSATSAGIEAQDEISVRESQRPAEKELATRERNTLLAIIAILCREAKLDYNKHAKTAGLIQGIADSMGVSIGETTIENHLKKIPDALGARTK